jgi:hypothetical protein
VCRKERRRQKQESPELDLSLITGLDGGHKTHAIVSHDWKLMVPAVLAARDCRRGSSIVPALDLHLGLPDFGKPPEFSGQFRLGLAPVHCNPLPQGISLAHRIKNADFV